MLTLVLLVHLFAPQSAQASIRGFSEVAPGIWRGSRPTHARDFEQLAALGIRTVIDLQGGDGIVASVLGSPGEKPEMVEKERALVVAQGLRFLHFPMSSFLPVAGMTALSIENALAALMNPDMRPIFIHCEYGRDRTGLIIALYRVLVEGWTKNAARIEWIANGHSGAHGFLTKALDPYFDARTKAAVISERSKRRKLACRDAFSP